MSGGIGVADLAQKGFDVPRFRGEVWTCFQPKIKNW